MRRFNVFGVEVVIYKNRSSMCRAAKKFKFNTSDNIEAGVLPVNHKGILALMFLHESITIPALVHEALHAALVIIRHYNPKSRRHQEEIIAYTQTVLVQEILKRFNFPRNSDYEFHSFSELVDWIKSSY